MKQVLTGLIVAGVVAASAANATEDLPEYVKTSGVSGSISSVGSDTLANLPVEKTQLRVHLARCASAGVLNEFFQVRDEVGCGQGWTITEGIRHD